MEPREISMSSGGRRTACEGALRAIAKALRNRRVELQPLHVLICVGLTAGACATASAAPFVPQSDGQVLERLPFALATLFCAGYAH